MRPHKLHEWHQVRRILCIGRTAIKVLTTRSTPQPCAETEFVVSDPNGYTLVFAELVLASPRFGTTGWAEG